MGQAQGFSAGARAQAVASAITEGHQRALQAHVDDYSNRDANGDPIISTPGPVYVARAFAMIHVAMYDAFVGISGNAPTYLPYDSLPTVPASAPRRCGCPCGCVHCHRVLVSVAGSRGRCTHL